MLEITLISQLLTNLKSLNKEKWKTCDDFYKEIEIIENDPNTKAGEFLFELNRIGKYFNETYGEKSTKNKE